MRVCVCATPPFGSPFCRKWMEWSVSKIYVAGDAANNHKKRSNGGGDFRQPGSALRFGVGIATPTPPSILANVFFVFSCGNWQTGTKSEASINNSSLLFKRSRGACNRVSVSHWTSPAPLLPRFPSCRHSDLFRVVYCTVIYSSCLRALLRNCKQILRQICLICPTAQKKRKR